ncbi:LamB/YcsF family protein [Bacillus sp. FJAT-45066]|uniref:LamB/YcsF family protein n=1 Tax=Bacillus sp. FJAT-45066 TaxID=2011010 RepID=UPI000BB6BDAB|nr:5-oxoprolinase subunit PxpA [Bacillus sp. FJAT-45066]
MRKIDLNCDLGESFGPYTIGNDELILPFVSSVNIACGFHAGDPATLEKTVQRAKIHSTKVGAHPGFQDRLHFGRRALPVTEKEAYQLVLYQLGALAAFCKVNEVELHHVKPHGALYNMAAKDRMLAQAIATAVVDFNPSLILYGLSNSALIEAGQEVGLQTASEAFADRTYLADGTLSPRHMNGSVIQEKEKALAQVRQMLMDGTVTAITGEVIPLKVDTICLHGDNEHALLFSESLHAMLNAEGISIEPIQKVEK